MPEKRKLGQRIGDTVADLARYITGTATPAQIRQERRLEEMLPEMNQLELARKNLENQQLTAIIQGLQQEMTGRGLEQQVKRGDIEALGGRSADVTRLLKGELPESAEKITTSKQAREAEARTERELGTTPETARIRLGEKQIAGPAAENLAMVQQLFPDKSQRKAMLATLKTAGFDTSGFEKLFGEEEAADKAKAAAVLGLEGQGKTVGQQGPSRFKLLLDQLTKPSGASTLGKTPKGQSSIERAGSGIANPFAGIKREQPPQQKSFADLVNELQGLPPQQPQPGMFPPGTDFGFRQGIVPRAPVGESFLSTPQTQEPQRDPIEVLLELIKRRQQPQ